MLSRHLQRSAMIVGAVMAALLFFLGGAALRLLMGPISLGPFTGAIEDSLNRSVSGLVVRFDQAVLEWSRNENKVNLIILGTKIFDVNGHIVAQAPKADLDFDAASLIGGNFALKRFALMEVQITAVRNVDGAIRLGFGPIEGSADLLKIIRETLARSANEGSSLETFSIKDARLAFRDDPTGLFIVAPNISFTLADMHGQFDASLDAAVEISGAPARLSARAVLRGDGTIQHGTVDIHGLALAAVAANSAKFAALKPYALKTDLMASFAVNTGGDLIAAGFQLSGAGDVAAPPVFPTAHIDRFLLAGRYSGQDKRVVFDKIDIAGPQAGMTAKGDLQLAWDRDTIASVSGLLAAGTVRVADPTLFALPVVLTNVSVRAAYDRTARRLAWEGLTVAGEGLNMDVAAGEAVFAEGASPSMTLSGTVMPLMVKDLLRYWPLRVSPGAREWIVENVSEGRLGPIAIAANIPKGAFDQPALPESALSLSFVFDGMTAQYLKGLTLLTGARGDALLTGDTFRARVSEGHVGPLLVSQGDALIANLHVPGNSGTFKLHVDGTVPEVLALIDQQPLGYATRFNLKPAATTGRAALDLAFVVPMRRSVKVEDVQIGISAKLAELGIPIDEKRRLENANANLAIDGKKLAADGTGMVSGIPTSFAWTEEFAPATAVSTHLDVQARLDDAARARLGVPVPSWMTGQISATLAFTGRRFHFDDATLRADLTGMAAEYPSINLTKRAGTPANATAAIHFGEKGAVSITDLVVTGSGLEVRGDMALDGEGNLVSAALPMVRAGANSEFALNMEAPAGGVRAWHLRGRSLDASRIVGGDKPAATAEPSKGPLFDKPVSVDARFDKVVLEDSIAYKNVSLSFAFGANERLAALALDAEGPTAGRLTGRLTEAKGVRSLTITADQGADFVHAMTGFPSLRNGKLVVQANFAPDAPAPGKAFDGDYSGTATLSDFSVMDQPFLARLFSIGSLDGPLRLLQGQGIAFTKLEAPFIVRGKQIAFHDGRASGPAIGFSFQGNVDRERDTVDLSGSLVPVYGLNSFLGAIPLLGDLLVSKPGEGIIGVTYRVRGPLDEPNVTVNPLSALAPGILRRIFEFVPLRLAPAPQAQQPAPPKPVPPNGSTRPPVTE